MLFQVLLGGAWIACLVLVIIEMFNKGQKGLGILTIVLSLCFGIGGLIALIWGLRTFILASLPLILSTFSLAPPPEYENILMGSSRGGA